MSNQFTLFNPTMPYIPMFNAKCRITPEMEARFADVYKKRVRQEGHKGSLPPDMTVSRGGIRLETPKICPTKTKKEVILSLFEKPILRADVIRKAKMLGISEGTARHHIDGLEQIGAIKGQGKVVGSRGSERILYVATNLEMQSPHPHDDRVLAALDRPKTRQQIADECGMTKKKVETITSKLEKKGRIRWNGEMETGRNAQKFWERVDL